MSEMIERVARAIANDLAWCSWDEYHDDKRAYIAAGGRGVTDVNGPFKSDFRSMARAAIEAMREPSMEMVRAVCIEGTRGKRDLSWLDGYQIMIDAGLAPPTPSPPQPSPSR